MKERILEKLKKLVAHAESASAIGSTAEAQAFAAKIQSLLDEHNLSMDDVDLHAVENSPIEAEAIFGPPGQELGEIEPWQGLILSCISLINGCYSAENAMGFLLVVGRENDRKIVINFYRYFEKLGKQIASEFERSYKSTIAYQVLRYGSYAYFTDEKVRRRSYMLGFGTAVCEKLTEIYGSDSKASKNSKALVSLNRRATESEEWIRERAPFADRHPSDLGYLDRSDFDSGVAAGNKVAMTEKILA